MLAEMRRQFRERGEVRLGRWGTFLYRFAVGRWQWAVALCKFEDHWSLHLFCLWITLWKSRTPPYEIMESWGFSWHPTDMRDLHLNWGRHTKIIYMPWAFEFVRKEVGMPDGSFVVAERSSRLPRWLGGRRMVMNESGRLEKVRPWRPGQPIRGLTEVPGRYRQTFPYHYRLDSGEVQERTAAVTVDRMTWAWRWPCRLGLWWPRMTRTSISVDFDDEVGEGTGSWKGGTMGCGYDLRPGETPEQSLRRMERERKFTR